MRHFSKFRLFIAAICAVLVASCASKPNASAEYNADMAACTQAKPPSDDQIAKMSTVDLYRWYKLSERAMDQVATASVLKQPIDPCIKALSWKHGLFERELKYR